MKKQKSAISKKNLIEFIKSNIAGNSMFATTYITYFICDVWFGMSLEVALLYATISGNTIGVFINFLFQKFWVFNTGKNETTTMQVSRYVIFIIMNAVINYGIIYGLEALAGVTPYIGQFVAGWFFFVWNYIWYKLWVFKKVQKSGIAKTKQKAA